jgi:hypothetical protein
MGKKQGDGILHLPEKKCNPQNAWPIKLFALSQFHHRQPHPPEPD